MKNANKIELQDSTTKKTLVLLQEYGRIDLRVRLSSKYQNRLLNDHPRITAIDKSDRIVTIVVDEYISKRLLIDIIKHAI